MPDPVLILSGPPGAGKTTIADILATVGGRRVHLESDLFFRFICAGYVEPWKPEAHRQNVGVMRIVAAAAAGYAEAGYITIIDGIISPRWFLDSMRDGLEATGNTVAYCVLRAPLAVCAERVASREANRITDLSVLERVWSDFADLGSLEGHVIDTDDRDSTWVAEKVAQRCKEGLLHL